MSGEREWWQHEDNGQDRRLASCVAAWPECDEGEYNPSCCRFPKSCSATVYRPENVTEADLEPRRPVPDRSPAPDAPQEDGLSVDEANDLTGWFANELTYDRFKACSDEELADLLAPTVERILADRLAARDRDHEAEMERRAVQRAAHYFRNMAQESLSRREVIDTLDYLARTYGATS